MLSRPKLKEQLIDYKEWHKEWVEINPKDEEIIADLNNSLPYKPSFSINLILDKTDLTTLSAVIQSIQDQIYSNWILNVITTDQFDSESLKKTIPLNDERIKLAELETTELKDWVINLDSRTLLNKAALFSVASSIVREPKASLIYSDNDYINSSGLFCDPYMKPDWNLDLFESINFLKPFMAFRQNLLHKNLSTKIIDHEFLIQTTKNLKAKEILHIPQILATTYAIDNESHLVPEIKIKDENFSDLQPLVSIIIPTRDQGRMLKTCLDSIYKKTSYKNFEIVLVDHQSKEKKAKKVINSLKEKKNSQIEEFSGEFNFSAMVNKGAEVSEGEILVFLNNDTEIIKEDWLELLVAQTVRQEVGVCGALLLFKNGTIQHAGIHPAQNGLMAHAYKHENENSSGYFGHLKVRHQVMAITGACLATRKNIWMSLGGFDEKNLKVAYNDVDFCLKAREAGLLVLFEPKVKLFHHESASRGIEKEFSRNSRLKEEVTYMRDRWGEFLFVDPISNPNLLITEEGIRLNPSPKNPPTWKILDN